MEKIGIVLLDPSTVKLVLAYVEYGKYYIVFDEIEESIKLSKDIERDGIIKSNQINDSLKILKMFKKLCESQGISNIVAYARSFIGEAKNNRSFLEEIESASGIQFKMLSDQDEMGALYSGVINTLDVPRGVIIDIENTATHLLKYNRRNILNRITIPIGAETLSQLFLSDGNPPEENCIQMIEYFKDNLQDVDFIRDLDEEYCFVGVGAVFDSLGKLSRKVRKYPLDVQHNYMMSHGDVEAVYDIIKELDIDKTKKLKGISNDRADILASGLSILKAIYDCSTSAELVLSSSGIQDGLLFNHAIPTTLEKPINDILYYSLNALANHLVGSKRNGETVCNLSIMIFRQLKVLHKLPRTYVKSLKVASFLYSSGEIINFYNMRRNAFNIILSSNIYGVTHKELLLGAFIAWAIDSQDFNLSEWVKYKDILDETDLDAMKKLAAIVKIAIGMDITQHGFIKDIVCDVLGDSVIMKTISEDDITFEIKHALTSTIDFKKAFGKYLEIL